MSDDFEIGERLNWEHNNLIKPVVFRGMVDDKNASVAFGRNSYFEESLWSAPLSELSRPTPPVLSIPAHPIPLEQPDESSSLDQHREHLKLAIDHHRQAVEQSHRAEKIADRALEVVTDAHTRLREYSRFESQSISELVSALQGQDRKQLPMASVFHGNDYETDRRAAALCERAYSEIARELAQSRQHERDCLDQVYKCAADITGILLSRRIERLHELETEAAELRAKLKACCLWWPASVDGPGRPLALSPAAASIISSDPPQIHDPSGFGIREQLHQERQQDLVELFDRLINGDIDTE
jgi:hypothetical protein